MKRLEKNVEGICPDCGGKGKVARTKTLQDGTRRKEQVACITCRGTGKTSQGYLYK